MSLVYRQFKEEDGKGHEIVTQDVEDIYKANRAMRNATPETAKYKGNLVHVMRLPMVTIEQMRNGQCCSSGITYNLMSADPEERKRALVHAQNCHKEAMTIEGNPIAKKVTSWR